MSASPTTISVVIPVKDEVQTVAPLLERLHQVLFDMPKVTAHEIIFVDDGSTDGTREALEELARKHPAVKVILFRGNFGKSAALGAGFAEARHDFIITMDGDLQDDPAEIPRFVELLERGYDLVSGWKFVRHDSLEKRFPSKIFNFLISRLSGIRLHDFNCGFKAYRSWCLKNVRLSGNLYRFLPVFVARQGGKITELPVRHHARKFGRSKYGPRRYFHGLFDLFTMVLLGNFFFKPMYFFGMIAVPLILFALSVAAYLIGGHVYWLVSGDQTFQLHDRPMLGFSLTMLGLGLNILLVGLLAEMLLQLTGANQAHYFYSIEKTVVGPTLAAASPRPNAPRLDQ
jgi:glycosyltransferase involved in cell wall biosynthesis